MLKIFHDALLHELSVSIGQLQLFWKCVLKLMLEKFWNTFNVKLSDNVVRSFKGNICFQHEGWKVSSHSQIDLWFSKLYISINFWFVGMWGDYEYSWRKVVIESDYWPKKIWSQEPNQMKPLPMDENKEMFHLINVKIISKQW